MKVENFAPLCCPGDECAKQLDGQASSALDGDTSAAMTRVRELEDLRAAAEAKLLAFRVELATTSSDRDDLEAKLVDAEARLEDRDAALKKETLARERGLELLRKAGKSATSLEQRRREVAARAEALALEVDRLRTELQKAAKAVQRETHRAEAFRHELWTARGDKGDLPPHHLDDGEGGLDVDDGETYLGNVLGCFGGNTWNAANPCGAGENAVGTIEYQDPDAAGHPVEFVETHAHEDMPTPTSPFTTIVSAKNPAGVGPYPGQRGA